MVSFTGSIAWIDLIWFPRCEGFPELVTEPVCFFDEISHLVRGGECFFSYNHAASLCKKIDGIRSLLYLFDLGPSISYLLCNPFRSGFNLNLKPFAKHSLGTLPVGRQVYKDTHHGPKRR